MKNLTALLCMLFLSASLMAQVQITAVLETDTNFEGVDLTDPATDLQVHITVENVGAEIALLKWEVSNVDAQCFAYWDWLVCDNNNCYTAGITTNVDPMGTGINNPSELGIGESYDFIIHVPPGTKAGCCELLVEFFSIDADKDVIASVEVPVQVNDPTCAILSSLTDVESTNINIYPNPSAGIVNWTSDLPLKHMMVTNLLGARVEQHDVSNRNSFDLSHLKSGYYNLTFTGEEVSNITTFRFFKG